jgi:threonyl-tRNA synthetase
MDMDGTLHDVEKFNYGKNVELKKLATYETKKVRVYEKEPPHIKIMKEHSIIDYEPGSDSGNFRILPKGRLMKKILERAITDWCVDAGAVEVETPIMYDYEHPSLKKYLNRFPARQYVVISDEKKLFLRFAACFGQFLIAHDTVMSHKNLPLKMFELTRYSFRREQSGELAGLKRLRAFTMPDMHTFAADIEQAKFEFEKQYDMGLKWNNLMGVSTEVAFRIQEDFLNENKDWYVGMVKKVGKPIFIEVFKERYAYFITKFEFNFIDSMDKASTLTTVQIDVENADTYDINYVAADGSKKRPFILHASISGSLERVIYALLEAEAMKMAQGKKAMLPVWLSPTQIRVIPVGDKHKARAVEVLGLLNQREVRADFDDRDEPLGKKIRDAQKEWVPYVIVIGDNEIASGKLSVNVRATDEKKEMSVAELVSVVEGENDGKPFEKSSLQQEISKRAII